MASPSPRSCDVAPAAHLKLLHFSSRSASVCAEPSALAASQVFSRPHVEASFRGLPPGSGHRRKELPMVVRAPRFQARTRRARTRRSGQLSLAVAVLVALAFAAPAGATQPPSQQFRTIGQLTGADTAAGTWIGAGLIDGAGTYTELFRFAGGTIHAQKVLVNAAGTVVLETRGVIVWLDACTVGFKAGSWHISDATGTYADLKG